jgi:hypothetical protein
MSKVKRELERIEGLQQTAIEIALETGAIEECEIHEGSYIDQYDSEAVSKTYAIGTNKVKSGEIDGTHEEMMEAIKSAIDDAVTECGACANYRNRDD